MNLKSISFAHNQLYEVESSYKANLMRQKQKEDEAAAERERI